MDKTLVIFYSYTGTSKRLAQLLGAQLGWQLGEVVEVRSRGGMVGMLRCMADSLLRRRPRIRYEGPNTKNFESVVLISPIWFYRLSGPMRSFVADRGADLRAVAVVSVMGAKGGSNAAAEIARLMGRDPLMAASFSAREVEDGSCASRLQAIGQTVEAAGREEEPLRAATLSPPAV
jgi:hypothetical protein